MAQRAYSFKLKKGYARNVCAFTNYDTLTCLTRVLTFSYYHWCHASTELCLFFCNLFPCRPCAFDGPRDRVGINFKTYQKVRTIIRFSSKFTILPLLYLQTICRLFTIIYYGTSLHRSHVVSHSKIEPYNSKRKLCACVRRICCNSHLPITNKADKYFLHQTS